MIHQGNTGDFNTLVSAVQGIHGELTSQVRQAINTSLTIRNWLIGCYIAEYELHGNDRAVYGEKLLVALAKQLTAAQVSNCNRRQLYRYLRFYRLYPQIVGTLSAQFQSMLPTTLSTNIVGTVSSQSNPEAGMLISRLSYSHFDLLVGLDDEKRQFYTVGAIKGCWSVRELKRQIGSLYFERSALSENKEKLAGLIQSCAEKDRLSLAVRDPYVFEFLGLKPTELMSESDLEGQLIAKLQEFLLELGHGFCFEARQKRILIGAEHFFVDLVFYHRILKCHVLVELKLAPFSHESIGELNTYVSWYRKNMMMEGDNPPVGLLLCTDKNHALAEYALAGMDNSLFVSKYQLELPRAETVQDFIEKNIGDTEG